MFCPRRARSSPPPSSCPARRCFCQKTRGFLHIHLLWEVALPIGLYALLLFAVCKIFPDPHDVWLILAVQLLPLSVGLALIYLRYRGSVLKREILFHVLVAGVGMKLLLLPFLNHVCVPLIQMVCNSVYVYQVVVFCVLCPVTEELFKFVVFRFVACELDLK